MVRTDQIRYVLIDIMGIDMDSIISIDVNGQDIVVRFTRNEYKEPVFDFENTELSDYDLEKLDYVYKEISFANRNNHELMNVYKTLNDERFPFLKIIHFFINEFYFFSPAKTDKHNRITSDSVYGNLKRYLNYPIVDVLIDNFNFRFLHNEKSKRRLFLTSDFDYINLWKYLGPFKTVWRLIRHIYKARRILLIEEFWSIWLSEKVLGRNFMLNNAMFLFDKQIGTSIDVENIAFLLVHRSHKKYDFKNDFECAAFRQFLLTNIGHVKFGIHPSYNTRYDHDSLAAQIETFDRAVMERPRYSRFHYLNCSYPDDMLALEKQKIMHDFSFYFCDGLLFRGGTTRSFKQWSKDLDRPINVIITPLSIMDVTLSKTLKLKYDEAESLAKEKIRLCFLLGNTCVLLWHNNEMYEPLYRKNYSARLIRTFKKHIEELEMIR